MFIYFISGVSRENSSKDSKIKRCLRRTVSCPEIPKPLEDIRQESHLEPEVLPQKVINTSLVFCFFLILHEFKCSICVCINVND